MADVIVRSANGRHSDAVDPQIGADAARAILKQNAGALLNIN